MTDLTYENVVGELQKRVPGFAKLHQEHVSQHGELLRHVLFGDLVRFLDEEIRVNGPWSPVLAEAMGVLERAMGSQDPKLQELVAVSFIENLEPRAATFGAFRRLFGPNLEAQLRAHQADLPPK